MKILLYKHIVSLFFKAQLQLPQTWNWKDPQSDYELVKVDRTSNEFMTVYTDFINKMASQEIKAIGVYYTLLIKLILSEFKFCVLYLKIERIQNKRLYQGYLLHKEYLKKKNGDENEKILYHGTEEKNINLICEKGFNRSYCGTNGMNLLERESLNICKRNFLF